MIAGCQFELAIILYFIFTRKGNRNNVYEKYIMIFIDCLLCNSYICDMIAYKYKLYRTDKTKHLDKMLREACFVWNHALALQKRYYKIYHKYIGIGRIKAHFVKHIGRCLLHSQTVQ